MGKHRLEDSEKFKRESEEFQRRSRMAIITVGKHPKLTKSDTDEVPSVKSRVRGK